MFLSSCFSLPPHDNVGIFASGSFLTRTASLCIKMSLCECCAQVASEQDVRRMSGGSLPHSRSFASRPGVAAAAAGGFASDAAAAHFPGPGPTPQELSVAEEMVEASYARGLAAAECFEVCHSNATDFGASAGRFLDALTIYSGLLKTMGAVCRLQ